MICFTLCSLITQSGPILMKQIIIYLDDENENSYSSKDAYIFAGAISFAYFFKAILLSHGFHYMQRSAYKTLTIIQSTLFHKIFALSQGSIGQIDQGKIISLSNNDTFQIFQFFEFGSQIFLAPLTLIISVTIIILEIGWAGIIGIIIAIFGTIINGFVSVRLNNTRRKCQGLQDERAKLLSEFLRGIKLVKYYGWEKFVLEKILGIRLKEARNIFTLQLIRILMDILSAIVPLLISIITLQIYVGNGNELTGSKALVVIGYINLLNTPLRMLGFTFIQGAMVYISTQRIQNFCDWEEIAQLDKNSIELQNGTLIISEGCFCWQTELSKFEKEKFSQLYQKPRKSQVKSMKQKLQRLKKGNFSEINSKNTFFQNINLEINSGELISIIGKVGSGKSSILQAMLGEMAMIKGTYKCNGKIAYVTQTPWLLNETVKNNILFGEPYSHERYQKTIKICELEEDLNILADGDNTEIGESGINLSGGQKQRICLARAFYSNSDIYFFDDVLAALDSQVGKNIFQNLICNELSNSTRVMVTHQINYANQADKIMVMKNMEIHEFDTYENLLSQQDSYYNILALQNTDDSESENNPQTEKTKSKQIEIQLPKQYNAQSNNTLQENILTDMISETNAKLEMISPLSSINWRKNIQPKKHKKNEENIQNSAEQQLVHDNYLEMKDQQKLKNNKIGQIEEKQCGAMKWTVYKQYLIFGGVTLTIFMFIFQFFQILFSSLPELWVSTWADNKLKETNIFYIIGYYIILFLITLCVIVKGTIFAYLIKNAAFQSSKKLLLSILRSTMRWFDNTQSGKILNRANKDQEDIDQQLPLSFQLFVTNIFNIFGYFILIGILQPIFFILILILLPIYIGLTKVYMSAARELKRVESLARGPALSLFSEAFNGALVIRTYNKQKFFFSLLAKRLNVYIQASSCNYSCGRWMSMITDLAISVLVTAVVFLAIMSKEYSYVSDGSLIGVSILAILKITNMISFTIRMYSQVELQISAVERFLEYINKKDIEADWEVPSVPQGWPSQGQIEFQNVSLRYDTNLPKIIDDISLTVYPTQKIGIIGRTGSGKSTITLGLLRILETAQQNKTDILPEIIKGSIIIDGINIHQIGLHHLRQNITIIPQDPFIFSGTVRSNLDPFNQFTNEEIISSLKKAFIFEQLSLPNEQQQSIIEKELKIKFQCLNDEEKKLYYPISEGGSIFSLGQRQLLCMARAILKKSKILIMDEATSSIDLLTDNLIQQMIKTEFSSTTILTIAHRLNTIISYDKILVLDQGSISEFDSPWNLINNESSHFTRLIRANGQEFFETMYKIASENYNVSQD